MATPDVGRKAASYGTIFHFYYGSTIMKRCGAEMEKILEDELAAFELLYSLEENKTGAIINHDGKLLEKISRQQEVLIQKIQALEEDRIITIADFKRVQHYSGEMQTLKEISNVFENGTGRLMDIGGKLRDMVGRLHKLQKTNGTLINDNMEYYNILRKGLKGKGMMHAGYSKEGKEEETHKQSILFNQTV
jgi:flagellar biosynthesis/type III secretory pathway chaperone